MSKASTVSMVVTGIGIALTFASTDHPLGVGSYTTVNDRTVSVGALGMVLFIQPSQNP